MEIWASAPWDNDEAADWFSDLMETTNLRTEWLKGIAADASQSPGVVRAAAALFVMLGRAYIWPIETLQHDLELAISGLSKVLSAGEFADSPELVAAIHGEIAVGQALSDPERLWWKFW